MDISSYNYFFIFSPSPFFSPYPYVNNILKKDNQAKTSEKWGKKRLRIFP